MRTILAEVLIAVGNAFGFMAKHALATFTLLCLAFCAVFGVLATHSVAGMIIGALCGLPVAFVALMLLGEADRPTAGQMVDSAFEEASAALHARVAAYAQATQRPKGQRGSIAVGVFIILLVSILANAAQWRKWNAEHDAKVKVEQQLTQANTETKKCNDSIAGLETAAFERGKAAEKERAADEEKAKPHRQKARKILSTPPTQPGNDCGSARDRAFDWLRSRIKP